MPTETTRLQATIARPRYEQAEELAARLKVSTSQLVEESLALFTKIVMETIKGRRLALVDASNGSVVELASPSLSQIEWAAFQEDTELSPEAAEQVQDAINAPSSPTPALRKAFARRRP